MTSLPSPSGRRKRRAWAAPLVCALGAIVLAGMGTFAHGSRWTVGPWRWAPLGIVLACALVAGASVAARAWAGYWGVVGVAVGAFAVTQAMAVVGPGGDVLIPAGPLGYTWLVLAPAIPVVAAFAPRRWFTDPPPDAGDGEGAVAGDDADGVGDGDADGAAGAGPAGGAAGGASGAAAEGPAAGPE